MRRSILALLPAIAFLCSCSTPDKYAAILQQLTPEQKVRLLIGHKQGATDDDRNSQMMAAARNAVPGSASSTYPVEDLGIPSLVYADGPAGLRIASRREGTDSTFFCTGFPIGSSLASTWDSDLVEEVGSAMGAEVLEYGVDVLLAPGMNLMRNPLCGRNFEYYSEDPMLSGRTAAAFVRGVQGNGVGCSIKHFAANNQEVNRCSINSRISERTLRELYLRGFEIAVREGHPWTVMTSYNYINGEYASQSVRLTEDILRGEWGFDGLVMTDWGSGNDPAAQLRAGNDNIMPGARTTFDTIMAALDSGKLSWSDVEKCDRRMLALIDKCPKARGYAFSNHPDLDANAAVSRRSGAEGCVLLKNDDMLPLQAATKLALFGVASYETIPGGTGAGDVNKAYVVNVDEGFVREGFAVDTAVATAYRCHIAAEAERLADINLKRGWWHGAELKQELDQPVAAALVADAAACCDAAVITLGRRSGEGDDRAIDGDYTLRSEELALVGDVCREFHALGKKVCVVLNVCGPVQMRDWDDQPDAVLVAWLPGQEAGLCVADVLSGAVNPSGRLPMTFALDYHDHPSAENFAVLNLGFDGSNHSFYHYRDYPSDEIKDVDYQDYAEELAVGYRYFTTAGVPVSYPFGFGLSYTKFDYSGFKVRKRGDKVVVSVTVTNAGEVAGKEVVQVYWSDASAPEGTPACELLCFGKTRELAPGESQKLTVTAPVCDMAHYSAEKACWVPAAGPCTIELRRDAETVISSVEL